MRFVDEYRDPARVREAARALAALPTRPWTVMEICGGQTHAIVRHGLHDLLPEAITLVHGPGCPVCVTPLRTLEAARRLARAPGALLCTFGDMVRVPGIGGDLLAARAEGGEVRVVHSPLDAVRIAQGTERFVALLAVGFETTAPATAAAVELADRLGLDNFGLISAHVLVPPAMRMLLEAPDCRIDGFLAAGHVATVAGTGAYPELARRFGCPIVVAGFEPLDLLDALVRLIRQLEAGTAEVDNAYGRAVRDGGNPAATAAVERVFEAVDAPWRGLGVVPGGGLRLRERYRRFDALERLGIEADAAEEPAECRAAEVLQGRLSPPACPAFGKACTPEHPLGAPMVSSEGACAAYFRYRRPVLRGRTS